MLTADMLASLLVSVIGLVYPIINNRMLNDFIPNHHIRAVVWGGILLMLLYVLRYALRYFVQYQGHMIGVGMQAQMRRDLRSSMAASRLRMRIRTAPRFATSSIFKSV